EKADRRVLVGEAGGSGKLVEHVAPTLRAVECRMHNLKAARQPDVFKIFEPLPVFLGQLMARPLNGLGRVWVEPFEIGFSGAILVVIALDAGHPHATDDVEAFFGISVVTDDIS